MAHTWGTLRGTMNPASQVLGLRNPTCMNTGVFWFRQTATPAHLTRRFGEPVPRLQRAPLHSRSRSGGPQLSRLRSCAGHVPTSLKDFLSSQSHWAPSLLHPQPENTAPDSAAKPALLQLPTKTSASCLRWLTLTGTGQRLSASRVPSASRQLQCLVGWGGLGRVGQQRFGRVQGDARGGCSCGAGVRR